MLVDMCASSWIKKVQQARWLSSGSKVSYLMWIWGSCWQQGIQARYQPRLWNPGKKSPEVQNRGISGPTKRTCVLPKNFKKKNCRSILFGTCVQPLVRSLILQYVLTLDHEAFCGFEQGYFMFIPGATATVGRFLQSWLLWRNWFSSFCLLFRDRMIRLFCWSTNWTIRSKRL